MIKLLIGGSPCTYWSIAQKNNRETEPSGLGWELFKNYLIAKEKFQPDFFLYENNKSAAQAIKDEIKRQLKVWDGTLLMEDTGARYIEINSALVSAQNRQRFYVHNCGEVEQPKDRRILLRDILESGTGWTDKSYAVTTRDSGAIPEDTLKRKRHTMVAEPVNITMEGKAKALRASADKDGIRNFITNEYDKRTCVAEPVCVAQRGRYSDSGNRSKKGDGDIEQYYEAREGGKTNALTTVQKDNMVAEPVAVDLQVVGRKRNEEGIFERSWEARTDGKSSALTTVETRRMAAEPVRVADINNGGQGDRIYSVDGKAVAQKSSSGGAGGQTGLYAEPIRIGDIGSDAQAHRVYSCDGKSRVLIANAGGQGGKTGLYACPVNNKTVPVYEVRNGKITIKDKQYPIKLADGFYIIRKLTVTECCRLQTMPDDYCRAVSASQAYKGLGNGWTAEVIIHILSQALKNISRDEKILVLSMYDGIGTGRYCLDKMGFKNVEYHAYEIDKYAMQIAMSNYPDIIQHGDAFAVREEGWTL